MASLAVESQNEQRRAVPRAKLPRRPRWKTWLFRAIALALGLMPLLLCELALRAAGIGKATDASDPFVGFSDLQPLFILNEQTARYEIPKSRQSHFQPDSFAAQKPTNEFRIFVLGGSTVQGRPWSIESSFTTWLELHLNAADPSRRYEVVNCGGVSYASYRLAPILIEVLNYQPDLVIFCEGHNEFLEDRCHEPLAAQPTVLSWAQRQATHSHLHNLLRDNLLASAQETRKLLGPEVDARLDWKDGMAAYRRDPEWYSQIFAHFDYNLRRIVRIAARARVPLLLVSPVSNLQFAPFKSEHRSGLTAAEIASFDALLHEASAQYGKSLPHALALLERARAIDDQYAQVHYEIGGCLLELGRTAEARAALFQAKELDVCPLRMLEQLQKTIHTVAAETKTPLLDAEALIAANSRSGFPDQQWMVDHVHPSISGHQLIADALAEKIESLKLARRGPAWEAAKDQAYRDHLATLDHVYFQRGKDRLKSEQGWAHGLAPATRANNLAAPTTLDPPPSNH